MEKILTILGVIAIAILVLLEGYNKYLDIETKHRLMPKEEVVIVQHHVFDTVKTVMANDVVEKSTVSNLTIPDIFLRILGVGILTVASYFSCRHFEKNHAFFAIVSFVITLFSFMFFLFGIIILLDTISCRP